MFETYVTAVVDKGKDKCSVYIPDLGLRQYGSDYVEAIGTVIEVIRAVKRYYRDCGTELEFTATAESASKMVETKDGFVTVLCVD